MMSPAPVQRSALMRRLVSQSALMLAGFGGAQVLGFGRNILFAHLLSKGDFGTAAMLTIALQTFETVSDVAVDRMVLQAADGQDQRMLATGHSLLMLRAALLSAALFLAAPVFAWLFAMAEAETAFRAIALIPLIKGLTHLDCRLAQRRLDNRAAVMIELIPQALAFAAVWPAVWLTHDYTAALWVTGVQAAAAVAASHGLASHRYRLGLDRALLWRFAQFGWPILLTAVPVLAVFQGDRTIVARYQGAEALAGYTAAFLITMVPASLAARVGLPLMVPLLSGASVSPAKRDERFKLMFEISVLAASLYFAIFLLLGGQAVRLAFGHNYASYGAVTGALALMWALRLLQAPFGAFLMAVGDNRPLMVAGMVRALALGPTYLAAHMGVSLAALGLCGAAGELASLAYFAWWLRRDYADLSLTVVTRTAFLGLTFGVTAPFWLGALGEAGLPAMAGMTVLVTCLITAFAVALLPSTRTELRGLGA